MSRSALVVVVAAGEFGAEVEEDPWARETCSCALSVIGANRDGSVGRFTYLTKLLSQSLSAAGVAPAAGAELAEGPILNVGHRGTAGLAPEHTIASYDLALEDGADYIEQDLRMTSDGVLVVLHDEDHDRTTRGPAENCTGPVSEKTLAQIKTCDVGSFFNERYPEYARDEYEGLKIPTLEEVFRRYRTETNYYIETRSSEAPPGNPASTRAPLWRRNCCG